MAGRAGGLDRQDHRAEGKVDRLLDVVGECPSHSQLHRGVLSAHFRQGNHHCQLRSCAKGLLRHHLHSLLHDHHLADLEIQLVLRTNI